MVAHYITVDANAVDELAARPEGVCVAEERFAAYGSRSVGAKYQVCSHRITRRELDCRSSEINLLHRAAKTDRDARFRASSYSVLHRSARCVTSRGNP